MKQVTQLKLFDWEVVPGTRLQGPPADMDPLCQMLFNCTEREFLECFETPSLPDPE